MFIRAILTILITSQVAYYVVSNLAQYKSRYLNFHNFVFKLYFPFKPIRFLKFCLQLIPMIEQ